MTFKVSQLLFAVLIVNSGNLFTQTFTWKKGSNSAAPMGHYGTMGLASVTNNPGGRENAASWTDASGNLWIFGGEGYDCNSVTTRKLSDLWKYDPLSNQWTFMKGDSINSQNGIYGTMGLAGPLNKPGSRGGAATWTDASGNLWLFGGYGYDNSSGFENELNDLWMYNISSNQWTWVNGSNHNLQPSVYGTQGVASSSNMPGARNAAAAWSDASGNLWLFGGVIANGYTNDLWKYNIAGNQWTWMKGANTGGQQGAYGVQGLGNALNTPGSRMCSASWKDAAGDFWLFGGYGSDTTSWAINFLNDLWKYSPLTNQWTWMKGSQTVNQAGIYGIQHLADPLNTPGARWVAVGWADAAGKMWLFGGADWNMANNEYYNDLWKYDPITNAWTWVKGSNTTNQPGNYGTQGVPAASNIPGARYVGACRTNTLTNKTWLLGGYVYENSDNFAYNDLWEIQGCDDQGLNITSTRTLICAGETATLNASGSGSYLWNTNASSASIAVSPTLTTTYTLQATTSQSCISAVAFTQKVEACLGLSTQSLEKEILVYPNPTNGVFTIDTDLTPGKNKLVVYSVTGQKVMEQALSSGKTIISTNLAPGLYHYLILEESKALSVGKLVVE